MHVIRGEEQERWGMREWDILSRVNESKGRGKKPEEERMRRRVCVVQAL